MLSMNGIIVCELLLGGVLMSLIFTSLANTDLIADSSSKSKHEPESDSVSATMKPGRALTEISCQMYMSVLAGDYYWAKATGAAPVPSGN
jgi:hypothetical protein